ncbi:hypothetical protein [Streptomyces specialis]|uniref:hypothetical protein n=1 Tax=Streptomyces specialis TaxID=498367 RepID=UPI000AAA59F7|nr:hypothetical protein [Streptomyces specialis]
MKPMPTTADVALAEPTKPKPQPRPEHSAERPGGPNAARCVRHPEELALRGIPVLCPSCLAHRDWLLINQGRHIWIRCRCGAQWLEPEITRADFDAMLDAPEWAVYPSIQSAMTALGFDSVFCGAYLPR